MLFFAAMVDCVDRQCKKWWRRKIGMFGALLYFKWVVLAGRAAWNKCRKEDA